MIRNRNKYQNITDRSLVDFAVHDDSLFQIVDTKGNYRNSRFHLYAYVLAVARKLVLDGSSIRLS